MRDNLTTRHYIIGQDKPTNLEEVHQQTAQLRESHDDDRRLLNWDTQER